MLKSAEYLLRKIWRRYIHSRHIDPALSSPPTEASRAFVAQFERNLAQCTWEPHAQYSVFTQYDRGYYTALRTEYLRKYRCFWAVAKTIAPRRLIELGTHAGSGADAYLSGSPAGEYIGLDQFPDGVHDETTGAPWRPFDVANALLGGRGYNYRLIKANLRALQALPAQADMVVVDAAHDIENEYADLRLALTANPQWLFVDDAVDRKNAGAALLRFLREDVRDRVEFSVPIDYIEGGLVIRLKPPSG